MHTDELMIRERAYQLWVQAGQPEAREEEFWFDAERELAEEEELDTLSEAEKLDIAPVMPNI